MSDSTERDRLEEMIRDLPRRAPRPGWQTRVFETIDDDRRAGRQGTLWVWLAGGATGVAALGLFLFFALTGAHQLSVVAEIEDGAKRIRSRGVASVGDTYIAQATIDTSGPKVWDVRVYCDDVLVASCGMYGCTESRGHLRLAFELKRKGSYRAVVYQGNSLPMTTGTLDADVAGSNAVQIEIKLTVPTTVGS